MKSKKYYWTLAVLAILFVFVILMDVAGFIGLFTGGKPAADDAVVDATVVVTEAPVETGATVETEAPVEGDVAAEGAEEAVGMESSGDAAETSEGLE